MEVRQVHTHTVRRSPAIHPEAFELASILQGAWEPMLSDLWSSGTPLAALTLAESAKLTLDQLQRGIVETFFLEAPLLEMLPMIEVTGSAYKYNEESTLPGIEFRAVNTAYNESTGTVNQKTESLVILGGMADVDRFLQQTRGNLADQRATQEALKAKALARKFQDTVINGDVSVDTNSFDGLKKRLTGTQVVDASTAANGLPIIGTGAADQHAFFDKVDELIAAVDGDVEMLMMHKSIRGKFRSAARRVGGFDMTRDDFGRPVEFYNGIRLVDAGNKSDGSVIIPLTEASNTAATTTTSIYAIAFSQGEDEPGIAGLNNGGVMVDDIGLLPDKPVYRTLIEMYPGLAVFGKGAARLRWVANG
jgi:hypothetical protein